MAVYRTTQDFINDALFRAGEIPGSSEWDTRAVDYLNRAYRSIINGTSEYLPEVVENWWWHRAEGVLDLEPVYHTGTVAVVSGSSTITFSSPPPTSIGGWRLKVKEHSDIFIVRSHAGMAAQGFLDIPYNGPSAAAAEFQLMKTTYLNVPSLASMLSPFTSFQGNVQITGMTPERLDFLYPIQRLSPGVPKAFAIVDDRGFRFSHGGLLDGQHIRLEYRFKPTVSDLENSAVTQTGIPGAYSPILADMVTVDIMMDKNDDRAAAVAQRIRGLLKAMFLENRKIALKVDPRIGAIYPRQSHMDRHNGPLRTESGLIIG